MISPATVRTIFHIIYLLVIAHVIISWVPVRRSHPAVQLLAGIVEPLLRPFRSLVPPSRVGGLDISPIILIVVLSVVERIIVSMIPGPVLGP
ncbi:hypothetical protein AMK68_04740 [candidate division KD3-62 bacterium DG_56]|uniref:YggT family protein n=1 Tax=candidate division KD3-62 bacterium DG_56 TaxID=1704032 RepID=A0A0S7XJX8_9BACT|nr:MAG: hypothetical protein AMK68_04740 [candidate division KD3-62 bacterium DG_56]